ncbi:MAG: UPF0182 family protein [Gemmatimonadales bacterium]
MKRRSWVLVSLAGLALLMLAGRLVAGIYAEWSWYAAAGALPLYRTKLAYQSGLLGGTAIAGFVLALANLYAVRSSIVSLVLPRRLGGMEFGEAVPGRRLTAVVFAISAVLAILLSLQQDDWTILALARAGLPFRESDPYAERDIGYYMYRLPFEQSLFVWAVGALATVGLVVVFLYALTPSLRLTRGKLYVSTYVRRHFAALTALAVLLVSWNYRLDSLSILANGSGAFGAFSAFDYRIAVPLLTALTFGTLVAAPMVLWSGWHGFGRITLGILALLVIAGPGARAALPALARWSTTDADARARETPYLRTRTLFTRRAFGLETIVDADSQRGSLVPGDAMSRGVSSWDPAALVRTTSFDRRGSSVGAFSWEPGPGGLTAVIATRTPVGGDHGAWMLTSTDATSADERGRALPRLTDFNATAEGGMPAVVVEPDAAGATVVADSAGRLVAPPFVTRWERLAHAWHLQSPRLMATDVPGPRPRIVFHRDVRERVEALAPFFTIGPTLLTAVRGDSLYWVADLFVTSDDYPLSEAVMFAGSPRHYVHKAATAFVQAQTGRVLIVADAHPDAVTQSWMRKFPWLFVPRAELSAALDSLRPPSVDWATVQAGALARTGFPRDSIVPRSLAPNDDAAADVAGESPTFFAPLGERGPLAWSLGVVDARNRVIGALVALGGASPRTEWHRTPPSQRWSALLERLQHAADSAGFGHQRRFARRGRVQLIPTAAGIAYVQTFYEWPPDAPPSIAGVVVLQRDAVRTGASLGEALGMQHPVAGGGAESLRARIAALYDAMSAALRRGDWRAFGQAYAQLGTLLRSAP